MHASQALVRALGRAAPPQARLLPPPLQVREFLGATDAASQLPLTRIGHSSAATTSASCGIIAEAHAVHRADTVFRPSCSRGFAEFFSQARNCSQRLHGSPQTAPSDVVHRLLTGGLLREAPKQDSLFFRLRSATEVRNTGALSQQWRRQVSSLVVGESSCTKSLQRLVCYSQALRSQKRSLTTLRHAQALSGQLSMAGQRMPRHWNLFSSRLQSQGSAVLRPALEWSRRLTPAAFGGLLLCSLTRAAAEAQSEPRLPRGFFELPAGAASQASRAADAAGVPSLGSAREPQLESFLRIERARRWWLRRLVLPAVALSLFFLLLTSQGLIPAAATLTSFLLVSRPSLESLEGWLTEQRIFFQEGNPGIVDRLKQQVLNLAQVEYQDCHLFAIATLNSLTQKRTLLGVFGSWWEIETVQRVFVSP